MQTKEEKRIYQREWRRNRRKDPAYRDKEAQYQKEWRESNQDRVRALNLKRYGLTIEEYDALLDKQNHKCAICPATDGGRQDALHVDHDHVTGRVRGLLCHKCNVILGYANDNPAILTVAVEYLKVNT